MRKFEQDESWVIYQAVIKGVVSGPNAVCEQAEWEAMERAKPGCTWVVQSGIATEGDHAVKVVSETGTVVVPRAEIDKMKRSDLSMMPEGLLNGLSEQDVADLVAYLRTSEQVPMPADDRVTR